MLINETECMFQIKAKTHKDLHKISNENTKNSFVATVNNVDKVNVFCMLICYRRKDETML